MPKQMLIPYFDGKYLLVKQKGERFALNEINKRIEYYLPIETVDVRDISKVIDYIRVNVNRPCSPEEVRGIVESIKDLLRDALENMPKHERYMYDKKGDVNEQT